MGLRKGTQGGEKNQGGMASRKSSEEGPSCRRLTRYVA